MQNINEIENLRRRAYAEYQLWWLYHNGYAMQDIFQAVQDWANEWACCEDPSEFPFEAFLEERGFGGVIWACYNEFLDCEYQDRELMKKLLNEVDYGDYLKDVAWVVTDVQPQNDYTLLLTFISGERRTFNARPLLEKAIYSPLKELPFFLGATVSCGSVAWSDEVDISPEYLYEASVPYKQTQGGP